MKKIPTLFIRDPGNPLRVMNQVNSACEWVVKGEGVATRKWDGQPLRLHDGYWFKRYTGDLRGAEHRVLAALSCGEDEDMTPIWWVPVTWTKEDQHIRAAIEAACLWSSRHDGTYEICGPHFCHNRERLDVDKIIKHGQGGVFPDAPVEFDRLHDFLAGLDIEGLVWHHPDGKMAKIKKSDFGLRRWPVYTDQEILVMPPAGVRAGSDPDAEPYIVGY